MESRGLSHGSDGRCAEALALIASYVDGELSEAQAGPLRRHLMDCPACRASAQSGRSLRRWFAAEAPPKVPAGFSARVARRAFAGDTGEREAAADRAPAELDQGRLLAFVLRLAAAAALLLIGLSVASRLQELPAGNRLRAEEPLRSTEEILRRLDGLDGERDPAALAAELQAEAARSR